MRGGGQALPQCQQVAGGRAVGLDAGQDAFQVGNIREGSGGGGAAKGVVKEILHGVQAAFQAFQVQEGLSEPAAQQARAQGGAGVVQGGQQRPVAAVPAAGGEQFQVAPGLGVQGHIGVGVIGGRRGEGGAFALVGIAQVVNDGAGGAHRQGQRLNAVGFQGEDAVVFQQGAAGEFRVEGGGVQSGDGRRVGTGGGSPFRRVVAGGNQYFGGFQAGQFQGQPFCGDLGGGKLSGSNINISEAGGAGFRADGGQIVVGLVVQQGGFQHGAGGYDADDAAFYDALGSCGVA